MSSEPSTLLSLFLGTPVGDHLPRGITGDVSATKAGPVMVVRRDETLPRVFRKLAVEGFLSAPVVDGQSYAGFIDMMDLVQRTKELFWGDTVEAWTNFWDKEQRFQKATVDDILTARSTLDRKPVPPIHADYTSFSALEMLVRGGYHRLAVLKPGTSKLSTILTQSMLISWLRQNKSSLGTLRTTRVSDMVDELKSGAFTVNENSKAINAFNQMAAQNVSGLAVVDDEGLLVGAISVRDLRGVGTSGEFFHRLFQDIKLFKKLVREEHPRLAPRTHYSTRVVPRKGLFVTPNNDIETVIDKMADGNIHRVFVCEDPIRPRPSYVISQVDVLRAVLNHCIKEAELTGRGQ